MYVLAMIPMNLLLPMTCITCTTCNLIVINLSIYVHHNFHSDEILCNLRNCKVYKINAKYRDIVLSQYFCCIVSAALIFIIAQHYIE